MDVHRSFGQWCHVDTNRVQALGLLHNWVMQATASLYIICGICTNYTVHKFDSRKCTYIFLMQCVCAFLILGLNTSWLTEQLASWKTRLSGLIQSKPRRVSVLEKQLWFLLIKMCQWSINQLLDSTFSLSLSLPSEAVCDYRYFAWSEKQWNDSCRLHSKYADVPAIGWISCCHIRGCNVSPVCTLSPAAVKT